jgi:hypothetical protein
MAQLSGSQATFVDLALQLGLDVDYDYSGRGMYGATCPAVRVEYLHEFPMHTEYHTDGMGLGHVVYCPR